MKQDILNCGQRISIVGISGSGKTTLARQISQRLAIPYVELDEFYWNSNWKKASTDVFQKCVKQSISADRWIVDGSYRKVLTLVWGRATTVVWLNYPLPVIMGRLMRRTWQRIIRQEELWSGNRETWTTTFSSDSLLLWVLTNYHKTQKEYLTLFSQPEYAHLKVVHLRSSKAAYAWLASLAA